MLIEQMSEERAKREYAAIKGFYIHVLVFVPVMLLLAAIDSFNGGETWVHWVLLGWGAGLALHGYAAFVLTPRRLAEWERRKLEANRGAT